MGSRGGYGGGSSSTMRNPYGRQPSPTIDTTATPVDGMPLKPPPPRQDEAQWAALERDIFMEHNKLRQDPQSYIPILEDYMSRMDPQGNIPDGCGPDCTLLTQEGQAAVQEAIRFLEKQQPVPPLQFNEALALSARSHADDQRGGSIGHVGSNGSQPGQRIKRARQGAGSVPGGRPRGAARRRSRARAASQPPRTTSCPSSSSST